MAKGASQDRATTLAIPVTKQVLAHNLLIIPPSDPRYVDRSVDLIGVEIACAWGGRRVSLPRSQIAR